MGIPTNIGRKCANLKHTHFALWLLRELAELAIPHKTRSAENSSRKVEMDLMMAASE